MDSDHELLRRQVASQRAFYRALADGSPGASLLELPGAQATLVPAREWLSIFNGVFYDDLGALERAHPALAAAYDAAGIGAWAVWVPPHDPGGAELLRRLGHLRDSTPMLFVAPIDDLDLRPGEADDLDLDPDPGWDAVARVNDRAYGVLEPWTLAAAFSTMRDPASRLHVARREGEAIAALIAREHDGDCYLWFVATVPEARRSGAAGALMRHALREARGRGCTTSTLESTAVAETLYRRLGYRALGRYEMWELRSR
jgi:ribosomal protein S18 acetylase RimI-like enzyme